MKRVIKTMYFLREYAIGLMSIASVLGLLLLYFKVQNDLNSPMLFLFKAAFFPLSLLFLLFLWLLTLMLIKDSSNQRYRKWPVYIALFISCVLLPHILPNWQRSSYFSETANQQGFSVASFSAMTRSRNAEDIKVFIDEYQPQILCLQEVTAEDMQVLSNTYPYQHRHSKSGLVILSQFPLLESNSLDKSQEQKELNDNIKKMVQSVELTLPNQRQINILNVHMPRQYREDGYAVDARQSIQWHTRTELPLIFCGDFNMTPHHTVYDYLTNQLGLADAQLSQSWEYGFTFPNGNRRLANLGVWLRIDYLFSRGFLQGTTSVINVSNLSDHKAVLSKFLLTE